MNFYLVGFYMVSVSAKLLLAWILNIVGNYFLIVSMCFWFQLKENRSLYEGYVPMKYKKYYKKVAK